MKRVYFDTETSGLSPGQIGQLALIIEEDGKELVTKNYYFKMKSITEGAVQACGRDLEFYERASNGNIFADYKDEIYELLSDATLIAHNIKFDENFISTEFWRQNISFKPKDRFDTMEFFKNICKIPSRQGNKFKNPKLIEVIQYYNIDEDKVNKYSKELFKDTNDIEIGFHDAMYDTTAMFVAFQMFRESLYNKDNWKRAFSKS